MSEGLFRLEAVDHARERLGGTVNNFGIKSWVLVTFLGGVFLSAVVFISIARYSKKETVLGSVVPSEGVARLAPLRGGTVKAVLVKSGEAVTKGQPLFAISYDVTLEDGGTLGGRINAATDIQTKSSADQSALRKLQIAEDQTALRARKSGLLGEVKRLKSQYDLQAERVTLLENTVASSRTLYEQKYMSLVQLRQREDSLIQAKQSLLQIEQSMAQTEAEIEQIVSKITNLSLALSEADASLRLSRAQLDEKHLAELSTQGGYIVSPKDGLVTSLEVRAGDVVSGGQTLGMVVPHSGHRAQAQGLKKTQAVHLWVPSRAVGFVERGTKVRLMFDAFPYQTFGVGTGRVTEVATAPVMPNELPIPIETREQMYKIVVALDRDDLTAYGRNWALVPGMRLTADLVLDERSLLDWLLDPLIAARKRAA
jgi:membrane fusion protein